MYSYQTKDAKGLVALRHYDVRNDGTIWKNSKQIKPYINKGGYYTVTLYWDGNREKFTIHRLVALAYLKYQFNKAVNHINSDKLDNRAENLEYVTVGENLKHYWATGNYHSRIKLTADIAGQVREVYNSTRITMRELGAKYGLSTTHIKDVLDNVYWYDPNYERTRLRKPS